MGFRATLLLFVMVGIDIVLRESGVNAHGQGQCVLGGFVTSCRSQGLMQARPLLRRTVPSSSQSSFTAREGVVMCGGRASGWSKRSGAGGAAMVTFDFPSFDEFLYITTKGIVWGTLFTLIPQWTKERLREKEMGLDMDEMAEEEGLEDLINYVCATCDNTNEVDCKECQGKGFFVREDAQPKKCDYCDGLGRVSCPVCEERREKLKDLRRRRRVRPYELPPVEEDVGPWR
ncbi:unnamed protein product [Discosporangium mesarthrocarpum]